MSLRPSHLPFVCLIVLVSAGCGGGGGSTNLYNPDPVALVDDPFSNTVRSADCSANAPIDLVSPSGQLYPCQRFVVKFTAAGSSATSGVYRVGTGFTQTALGDTEVESGTWTLVGNVLTCTSTQNGVMATGILDAPSTTQFPGYTRTLKIRFGSGSYKGQTVTYVNLTNPV